MSVSAIEDRLQSHSRAFTSLLELIPAKYYYGDKDNTSQWNKRKQTKAQSVIAKKARLDPDALGVELESEPKPADEQKKFEDKSERKGRKGKKSTTIFAPDIPTGEGGGGESDGSKGIEQKAQGIALDNLTFATELDASPPPPTTSTSDREYGITIKTAAGAEEPTTAARKSDQCARLAAKIQGLRGKRGGYPPSTTVSTNKSSKRKNAEAKRRKKDQRRQKVANTHDDRRASDEIAGYS